MARGSTTKPGGPRVRRTPPPRRRETPWGVIAAALVVALFVGGVLAYAVLNQGTSSTTARTSAAAKSLAADVTSFDESKAVNSHTQDPVTYPQTPPVGGPHAPVWQNCGIYDQPIKSENGVHSLEHGAVWITYPPSLPADQVAQLQQLVRDKGDTYVLLSPFPGLPDGTIYASSWGKQLKVTSASDPRLGQFIDVYRQNPQFTPEPGAVCSGGVGTPQS